MKLLNLNSETDLTPTSLFFFVCFYYLARGFVWRRSLMGAVFTEPYPGPPVKELIVELAPSDFSPLFHLVHLFPGSKPWMG